MAKKPETEETFRVHCEVDTAEEMGVVVAQLTRMGIKNVGHELVTNVLAYKNKRLPSPELQLLPKLRAQVPKVEIDGKELATEWMKENPTFKAVYLVRHFEAHGRTKNGAYTVLKELVGMGKLKRLGGGNYSSSDVKQIEGPKTRARFDVRGEDAIWRFIKGRKTFKAAQLRALFLEQGRNAVSVSPLLTALQSKRLIKHTGPGKYLVLKPKTKKVKPKKAKKQTMNGAMPTEETTHG